MLMNWNAEGGMLPNTNESVHACRSSCAAAKIARVMLRARVTGGMVPDPYGWRVLRRIGRLLLALGVLGGALVIAATLSQWTWSQAEPPLPPTPRLEFLTQSAAQAIAAGKLPRARQQLEEVLAEEPHRAPALLLQACIALETRDTPGAEAALDRLRSAAPGQLEPALLQRMLEYRNRVPAPGWRQAFLQAWTELGRSTFASSPLLPEATLDTVHASPLAEGWERIMDTPLRLTLVLASPQLSDAQARWLIKQLPALEEPALTQAASVALLAAHLPYALHEQARAAIRRRLSRLVEAAPTAMHPRLLLRWADNSEWVTFNAQELEELESIAALPSWTTASFTSTFLEARARLMETGLPNPSAGALRVALLSHGDWGLILLLKRAEATRSQLQPSARHRLGRVLWNIGSRLDQEATALMRMIGLQLMLDGATDLGDEAERERVDKRMAEARALLTAANHAAIERWPLPSLWEEVAEARARDEWAHVRELAGGTTTR